MLIGKADLALLKRRLTANDVTSEAVRPLILPYLLNPRRELDYGARLILGLLDLTVVMGRAQVPWYAQTLPDVDIVADPERFGDLPFVTRKDLSNQRRSFIADITTFAFGSFTGGTTGQAPLLVERALEEQRYFLNLMQCAVSDTSGDDGLRALGLIAENASHGQVFQLPTRNYAFCVNFEQESAFRKAEWVLQQEYNLPGYEPRISFIQGYFEFIHLLALYLEERGTVPPVGMIRTVSCYGMGIPDSRRAYVSDIFNAPVHDNFSLSEVMGHAPYSLEDRCYAYAPLVYAEVVDLATDRPIGENGTGELVLTSLFPFTQRFPLIRYRTGDIVTVHGRTLIGPLFRVRGRKNGAVALPEGQVLCHGDIMQALEDLPFVGRLPGLTSVVAKSPIAAGPAFSLESDKQGGIVLSVVLAPDATLAYGDNSQVFEQKVRAAVEAVLPTETRKALRATNLQVSVL